MGVFEEVGELAHVHLKHLQSIRGFATSTETLELKMDAVGDILIFLMGYCSYEGFDMFHALELTASSVLRRDWLADPVTGGSK